MVVIDFVLCCPRVHVQLEELMVTIRTTSAHYVRCMKPNPKNESGWIHRQTVVDQLRYGGVLEAVRVSRVGCVHGCGGHIGHEHMPHFRGVLFWKALMRAALWLSEVSGMGKPCVGWSSADSVRDVYVSWREAWSANGGGALWRFVQ